MPTLAEFTLTIHARREEGEPVVWTIFRFNTVRQFRAFQYGIQISEAINHAEHVIEFRVQGMQAPRNLMPSAGQGMREMAYKDLDGHYRVLVAGARQQTEFTIAVRGDGIDLIDPPSDPSLVVTVEKEIEIVRI